MAGPTRLLSYEWYHARWPEANRGRCYNHTWVKTRTDVPVFIDAPFDSFTLEQRTYGDFIPLGF